MSLHNKYVLAQHISLARLLMVENFPSLDATLYLLSTCKSIKAAGSDYLWNLCILREVKITVHDWFMMVAVEI
jgi:hypothetical protein